MMMIAGGNPREWLDALGDWIADGIGWLIAMEGARVGGNTANGGNAAAVVAYK
ncbi:MAG: hypothetical protein AUK63_2012 [bacterium P3]|nr:MAG: hypothetical protein AUK63_2012 [bacterium P3]